MKKTEVISLLGKVLELDPSEILEDSNLENLGWDSLIQLAFISELDSSYGLVLSSAALGSAVTVADLITVLDK